MASPDELDDPALLNVVPVAALCYAGLIKAVY